MWAPSYHETKTSYSHERSSARWQDSRTVIASAGKTLIHVLCHSYHFFVFARTKGDCCLSLWSPSFFFELLETISTMPPKETSKNNARSGTSQVTIVLLVIPYLVLFFIVWKQNENLMTANLMSLSSSPGYDPTIHLQKSGATRYLSQEDSVANFSPNNGWDPSNPLAIPRGEAQNLPSIRVSKEESASKFRKHYGGEGDKPHLGGFTEFDTDGVSPNVWKHMITDYGVRSFLDVGCGRGYGIFCLIPLWNEFVGLCFYFLFSSCVTIPIVWMLSFFLLLYWHAELRRVGFCITAPKFDASKDLTTP